MKSIYQLICAAIAVAAMAVAAAGCSSAQKASGAGDSETARRADNLQWIYIGNVTVHYYYETLLSQSWLSDKAEVYERMWDDSGNHDNKPREKKEYRALFQGIYYPVRRANKNEWRWMFHADNGYKYYFTMPDKRPGEI